MRGSFNGALDRVYLHSPVTIALWYDVAEAEHLFTANLAHAIMRSSLYANPKVDIEDGNSNIPAMFKAALKTLPYLKLADMQSSSGVDTLIEEWKKANAELAAGKEAEHV